ncbi:MAG: 30S ribosomal protein S20 [Desulfobulbaceae bacterium]
MANHKSALKRDKQSKVRRLRNRVNKTQLKGAVNKVDEAIAAGSEQQVREALQQAASIIQKTAAKGTIHKRTASRKVSRLAKRVNRMQPLA